MTHVRRITEDVTLVELPLPLEGRTSVSCFVVQGEHETALVDPGWSSPDTDRALLEGLDQLGLSPRDISRTLVTHHHWDHYTQGLTWQRTYGVPAYLGRARTQASRALSRVRLACSNERAPRISPRRSSRSQSSRGSETWTSSSQPAGSTTARRPNSAVAPCARSPRPATPAATSAFEVVGQDLLLTGDHVLPRLTPSIDCKREPDPHSLSEYLDLPHLVAALPDALLLPAHRAPDGLAADRARELISHHDVRLAVVADHVAAGRSTAYDVARAMPWTSRGRRPLELELIHRMTAVLEVGTHVAVLVRTGEVNWVDLDGVAHYTAR